MSRREHSELPEANSGGEVGELDHLDPHPAPCQEMPMLRLGVHKGQAGKVAKATSF